MFKKEINTLIRINAGSSRVWDILADLDAYPEWNPAIRKISGELKEGAVLDIRFQPEGEREKHFRPLVITAEPGRELRWAGHEIHPKLATGEHIFIIEDDNDGAVVLRHDEIFTGLLIPLLAVPLEKRVKRWFQKMNEAIKKRAEDSA